MTETRPARLLLKGALALLPLLLIVACGRGEIAVVTTRPPAASDIKPSITPTHAASATVTHTPSPTLTPSATPTATPSPTPTYTPTPTAIPLQASGDLRGLRLIDPVPRNGAPCGLVDLLDFPLNPPDADGVTGGGDFGRFRNRYDKYHAGEDWWGGSRGGGSSFGRPVYSIGHGQVTYAQPLGWGRDKGVVIIRHVFDDGSSFLSFYGHLDPPSVTLSSGQCVARGQQVGEIGRPRSSPHLHFEIRTILPFEPGPGYWPSDPEEAGWLPPTQTIRRQRIESSPGVLWTRSMEDGSDRGIGILDEDTFVAGQEERLIGVAMADGGLRWSLPISRTTSAFLIDTSLPQLYLADRRGQLRALSSSNVAAASRTMDDEWELDLEDVGTPSLIPFPGGGLIWSSGDQLARVSAGGEIRWRVPGIGVIDRWAEAGEWLLATTAGRSPALWRIGGDGDLLRLAEMGGVPVYSAGRTFLYTEDGVYRVDPAGETVGLIYPLPARLLQYGDAAALPGGGLLVAHADVNDGRLIAFDPDGQIVWQRSYREISRGASHPIVAGGQVYLFAQENAHATSQMTLFELNMGEPGLTRLFQGGARTAFGAAPGAWPAGGDMMILTAYGGILVALDLTAAAAAGGG